MTARERLELADLRSKWESGGLDAAGRRRCVELEEMERASAWAAEVPKPGPFDLFFGLRRLGDRRPAAAGLPVCAARSCRRTFVPTARGQELCSECREPARVDGAKVVSIGRKVGNGS